MQQLRDYQIKAVEDIFSLWEKHRSVMLQMPTAAGKTTVFAEIIRRQTKIHETNKRVLVLVHRRELLEQAYKRLSDFQTKSGLIISGAQRDPESEVEIASVQTLVRRLENPKNKPHNLSLIVIDEAHHAPAESYRKILKEYESESTKILGVTATPIRMNGEGFGGLFAALVTSDSISELIHGGFLCNFRHLATSIPDLSRIKIDPRKKDYDEHEIDILMRTDRVMADLIQSYRDHALGKKTLVFAVSQFHAKEICKRYNDIGIAASWIDATTPRDERKRILSEFSDNRIKVLANVNIFTEGFDCPDIEVVQLARPTKSLILYMQQIGRVMRPKPSGGYGLILDNACLWKEHGLITSERIWSLDGVQESKGKEVVAVKQDANGARRVDPLTELGLELIEVDSTTPSPHENALTLLIEKNGTNDRMEIILPENDLVDRESLRNQLSKFNTSEKTKLGLRSHHLDLDNFFQKKLNANEDYFFTNIYQVQEDGEMVSKMKFAAFAKPEDKEVRPSIALFTLAEDLMNNFVMKKRRPQRNNFNALIDFRKPFYLSFEIGFITLTFLEDPFKLSWRQLKEVLPTQRVKMALNLLLDVNPQLYLSILHYAFIFAELEKFDLYSQIGS